VRKKVEEKKMRAKQFEEMVKDVASTPIGTVKPDLTLTELGDVYKGEFILRIAKHLYNAGYRKQKDGRWKGAGLGDYYCSLCCSTYSGGDEYNYCPNCGAKMKGGAE
jgi:hypothetical protein